MPMCIVHTTAYYIVSKLYERNSLDFPNYVQRQVWNVLHCLDAIIRLRRSEDNNVYGTYYTI